MSDGSSDEAGIERAVVRWETAASAIALEELESFADFLRNADTRTLIEELMAIATDDERDMYQSRIARADGIIRAHAETTRQCVWGDERSAKHGWSADKQWWYFLRPRSVPADEWPVE
jgi:hypothetical protein